MPLFVLPKIFIPRHFHEPHFKAQKEVDRKTQVHHFPSAWRLIFPAAEIISSAAVRG
jgi:hypothetical protein